MTVAPVLPVGALRPIRGHSRAVPTPPAAAASPVRHLVFKRQPHASAQRARDCVTDPRLLLLLYCRITPSQAASNHPTASVHSFY